MSEYYRHCSICKKPIGFGERYFQCSVSTCNQKRTALYFCSVACWDAHVPGARHRDAWAEQATAPSQEQASSETEAASPVKAPERRIVGARPALDPSPADDADILVVVSKLKKYISDRTEMNTSSQGMGVLSDHLRRVCDEACGIAQRDGRKTVLERDFEQAVSNLTRRA